jgi:hypothetical protein
LLRKKKRRELNDRDASIFNFITQVEDDEEQMVLQKFGDCRSAMLKQGNGKDSKVSLNMIKSPVYDFYCASIHCQLGPLNVDESSVVRLRFRLWSKSLALVSTFFSSWFRFGCFSSRLIDQVDLVIVSRKKIH